MRLGRRFVGEARRVAVALQRCRRAGTPVVTAFTGAAADGVCTVVVVVDDVDCASL